MLKIKILLLFLLPFFTFQYCHANDSELNKYLKLYDKKIMISHYKSATKALLKAQKISPYNQKVISRMKRYKRIMTLKNIIDESLSVSTPSYAKEYQKQMNFNQKFYNPTTSDIVTSFLATAALVVGVNYVKNWSKNKSDSKIKTSSNYSPKKNPIQTSSSNKNNLLSSCSYKLNQIKNTSTRNKAKGRQIACSNGNYITVAYYYKKAKWKREDDYYLNHWFDSYDAIAKYICNCK